MGKTLIARRTREVQCSVDLLLQKCSKNVGQLADLVSLFEEQMFAVSGSQQVDRQEAQGWREGDKENMHRQLTIKVGVKEQLNLQVLRCKTFIITCLFFHVSYCYFTN